ncbi:MAG TPA: glycine zipper 2TM domain-containing protein [Sphingomonas sp.]|nr:glycine zipper 2TM domain-containing protein [Sphingomonas sp.]
MFRKFAAAAALATVAAGGIAAPAQARHHHWDRNDGYYRGHHEHRGYWRHGRCYDKGTGGLIIGGVAGGLLGNAIAGHGDKTLGTVLGAAGGALAGRAIDRSDGRPCG